MPTYHAIAGMDHEKAMVSVLDREHSETTPITTHNQHQGAAMDGAVFFSVVAKPLAGVWEILLVGPGTARKLFRGFDNLAADPALR